MSKEYLIDPKLFQTHLARMEPKARGEYIMKVAINMVVDPDKVNEPWVREKPKPINRKKKIKAFNQGYTEEFERFWAMYPKKKEKGAAFAVWIEFDMDKDLLATLCCQALEWQRNLIDWRKDKGQWVPKPEKYLLGRSWEDENPSPGEVKKGHTNMDGEFIEY